MTILEKIRDEIENIGILSSVDIKTGETLYEGLCRYDDVLEIIDKYAEQEQTGKWLEHHNQTRFYVKCSNCKTLHDEESNYCPYCGAKMVKSWESEDKYEI